MTGNGDSANVVWTGLGQVDRYCYGHGHASGFRPCRATVSVSLCADAEINGTATAIRGLLSKIMCRM